MTKLSLAANVRRIVPMFIILGISQILFALPEGFAQSQAAKSSSSGDDASLANDPSGSRSQPDTEIACGWILICGGTSEISSAVWRKNALWSSVQNRTRLSNTHDEYFSESRLAVTVNFFDSRRRS